MKTLNWQIIKRIGAFFMLAFVLASTTACGQKDNKAQVSSRYVRASGGWQQGGAYNPNTGQFVQSAWGAIYNFSRNDLQNFMGDVALDYISNRSDDSTGIRFRGQARQGSQIYILVWDQQASETGEAFYWGMNVTSVQGGPQQGGASIVASDEYGNITLQGSFNNGIWTGTIQYQNSDGTSGSLGQFGIAQQAIFY